MKLTNVFHGILAAALVATAAGREPLRSVDDLRGLEDRVRAVAAQAVPCTVALISGETGASGSGVVTSAEGLILTAAHVTAGVEEVEVVFPGGQTEIGEVLGSNFSKDIGMVQIRGEGPWPFVKLGQSDQLEAGDWVVAVGHSEGYDPVRKPPVRFGRVVSEGPGNFLTTDCTLIGGDSGGPLFDLDGRLVGIHSSIGESLKNNNHAGIGGFREDWERLLAGEAWGELSLNPLANPERPVIGIRMGLELRDGGVPVEAVTNGSPAAEAGIRRGDVIRSVDGSRIRGGRSLGLQLAKFAAGDEVKIGIQRGREMFETKVTLARADKLFEP